MPTHERVALLHFLLLPLLLLTPAAPAAAADVPPIFQSLTFEQASDAAISQKRLLILDAMTSWCGPCKDMDRTTWVDPGIVEWVGRHAVAIQLDMDQHRSLVAAHKIKGYPTVIVFRDGKEVERTLGFRDAAFMRTWLRGLNDGRTRADVLRERLRTLRKDAPATEQAQLLYELTELPLDDGALRGEATLWCLTLWEKHAEWRSGEHGQRVLGQLLTSTARLRQQTPDLTTSLLRVAEKLQPNTGNDAGHVNDWVLLQRQLEAEEAVVSWAERAQASPAGRRQLAEGGWVLFRLLVDAGAWSAAGHCLTEPVERLRLHVDWRGAAERAKGGGSQAVAMLPMSRDPRDRDRSIAERRDRAGEDRAATQYAALLAAGRTAEARDLAALLLQHLDRSRARVALVAAALRAGITDPSHLEMLDDVLDE